MGDSLRALAVSCCQSLADLLCCISLALPEFQQEREDDYLPHV